MSVQKKRGQGLEEGTPHGKNDYSEVNEMTQDMFRADNSMIGSGLELDTAESERINGWIDACYVAESYTVCLFPPLTVHMR